MTKMVHLYMYIYIYIYIYIVILSLFNSIPFHILHNALSFWDHNENHLAEISHLFCTLWEIDKIHISYLCRHTTKPIKRHMSPANTQIHPVWSVFTVCSMGSWGPNVSSCGHEDSDQTGRMPRLIWGFPGCTSFCWFCHVVAHLMIIIF